MRLIGSILLSMFIALVAALIMHGFDISYAKVTLMSVYTVSMLICLEKLKEREEKRNEQTSSN